jgi:toxin ParE1/3/4
MVWRFAGRAGDRIEEVVMASAQRWGIEPAARYNRLVFAALEAIGDSPALLGSRPVPHLPGVLSYHLRSGRRLVAQEYRVRDPRHLVLYRVAPDGVIEILGLAHDRQLLDRAARTAQREADG